MISKRKMVLSLLIGVPLALHGHPLDIDSLTQKTSLDSSIRHALARQEIVNQQTTDYKMKKAMQIHIQPSAKYELLRPRTVTAAEAIAPAQPHSLDLSRKAPLTILF